MVRNSLLLLVFITVLATGGSAFNNKELAYLETKFELLTQQLQAMRRQVDTLNAAVVELRQKNADLAATLAKQETTIKDLDQLLSTLRIRSEVGFSVLKGDLSQFRAETQKNFKELTSGPAPSTAPPAPAAAKSLVGYITVVDASGVTIDKGSAHGLKGGERLAAYNATDPNTKVAEVEVEQVIDSSHARCRVVSIGPGVRLDFGDIVRLP